MYISSYPVSYLLSKKLTLYSTGCILTLSVMMSSTRFLTYQPHSHVSKGKIMSRPKWEDAGSEKPLDRGGSGRDTYPDKQLVKKNYQDCEYPPMGPQILNQKQLGGSKRVEY